MSAQQSRLGNISSFVVTNMFDTVPAGNEEYQFNLSNFIFIFGRLIAHNWPEHGSHSVDAGFRYNHRAPAPKTEGCPNVEEHIHD